MSQNDSVTPVTDAAAVVAVKVPAQPWYQKQTQFNHNQKPGRPPNGSRRSMGKR